MDTGIDTGHCLTSFLGFAVGFLTCLWWLYDRFADQKPRRFQSLAQRAPRLVAATPAVPDPVSDSVLAGQWRNTLLQLLWLADVQNAIGQPIFASARQLKAWYNVPESLTARVTTWLAREQCVWKHPRHAVRWLVPRREVQRRIRCGKLVFPHPNTAPPSEFMFGRKFAGEQKGRGLAALRGSAARVAARSDGAA